MSSLNDIDAETLTATHAFMKAVAGRYEMVGAILFGSRARGVRHLNSDADVAVLLQGPG